MSDSFTLALGTCRALPDLSPDDRLLIEPLRGLGVEAVAVAWDADNVDWSAFDGVVVRSCWDYHRRHAEFLAWMDRVTALGVPMWNPPALMRWNSDKKYLLDLAGLGVLTVPTRIIARGESPRLADVLCDHEWARAVVKPSVSASAHETWLTSMNRAADHQSRFEALLERIDVLVQPYVCEVAEQGEWSLVFLGDEFSHAVLKRPAVGDFRVQAEHGGTSERCPAPESLVCSAAEVLRRAPVNDGTLYARVDGYTAPSGDFILMELELIEPLLYLADDATAPSRFARRIADRLASPGRGGCPADQYGSPVLVANADLIA